MAARDRRGARTGRRSRERASRRSRTPSVAAPPVYPHPVFGAIPLLLRQWTDADGEVRTGYEFDPDYQPPLPAGAVRGNPHRQLARGAFDVPRYFYVDRERVCVQCRASFVFGAQEQKHWYETLGFNFASVAVRCPSCRRQRRSDKALHHAVDDAKREARARPDDPAVQLALAEAIVALRARAGRGRLDEAVAAAREARNQGDGQPPAAVALTHFWEARAQALAGRSNAARLAFDRFLALAKPRAHRREIRLAERWLAEPRDPGSLEASPRERTARPGS